MINKQRKVKKIDMQLKEEMRMSGCSRSGGCIIMRRCNNYGKPGYNMYICKKDEEMSNVYSFE